MELGAGLEVEEEDLDAPRGVDPEPEDSVRF